MISRLKINCVTWICLYCLLFLQKLVRRHILERSQNKMQYVVGSPDLDLDYLNFMCTHELILTNTSAEQIGLTVTIVNTLRELCNLVRHEIENEQHIPCVEIQAVQGARGRPIFNVQQDKLQALIDTQLPITCISKLLGVSEVTVYRWMVEFWISVSGSYSKMSDQEIDTLVSEIKAQMPHIGCRLVMGRLRSLGYRVEGSRMKAAMHSKWSWDSCWIDTVEAVLCGENTL